MLSKVLPLKLKENGLDKKIQQVYTVRNKGELEPTG